jgi:hypothetical protein
VEEGLASGKGMPLHWWARIEEATWEVLNVEMRKMVVEMPHRSLEDSAHARGEI